MWYQKLVMANAVKVNREQAPLINDRAGDFVPHPTP
jgi:hypothetical protein